jgi:hypothetical protein
MSTAGLSISRLDRTHQVLSGYVERKEMPGLAALVGHHDDVHVEALGTMYVGRPAPMKRDTIFRIASLPWMAQPGQRWMYRVSGDVLGVLIARVSGQRLSTFTGAPACDRGLSDFLGIKCIDGWTTGHYMSCDGDERAVEESVRWQDDNRLWPLGSYARFSRWGSSAD